MRITLIALVLLAGLYGGDSTNNFMNECNRPFSGVLAPEE